MNYKYVYVKSLSVAIWLIFLFSIEFSAGVPGVGIFLSCKGLESVFWPNLLKGGCLWCWEGKKWFGIGMELGLSKNSVRLGDRPIRIKLLISQLLLRQNKYLCPLFQTPREKTPSEYYLTGKSLKFHFFGFCSIFLHYGAWVYFFEVGIRFCLSVGETRFGWPCRRSLTTCLSNQPRAVSKTNFSPPMFLRLWSKLNKIMIQFWPEIPWTLWFRILVKIS